MPFQPGANLNTVSFGNRPENVEVPHLDVRAPATTDIQYPVGKKWTDTVHNATYELTSFSVSAGVTTANWQGSSGGTVELSSLTGDSGGAVSPTAGNINILGTANQITSIGSGSTVTLSLIGPYTPATYTAHGALIGEGTGSIVATAAGTDGQVLTGATGADPSFGAIGIRSGLTAHGVVIAEGASAFAATAAGTTGQILTAVTGADPVWANNTGINIVNVSGTSQAISVATTYIANNAGLVTFTLPATANQGDRFSIVGNGLGGWRIAQNAGQQMVLNAQASTVGTGGSVSSTNHYNAISVLATVGGASTVWNIIDTPATLTFV